MNGKQYQFQDENMMLSTTENSAHDDVGLVQDVLRRFGYLTVPYQRGSFGEETARAVRRYQRFHRLTVDGIVGSETKRRLSAPRCGLADEVGFSGAFVLRGCKYDNQTLTYAFTGGTPDLPGNQERDIVRRAFDVWAGVTPLRFLEVRPEEGPDFRISWETGNHGDGVQNTFDGPGRTLAHAFFPPPCGGPFAGSLHFDEGEPWTADTRGIHLEAVAIHEIGHLLGLSHSDDPNAIMFPTYRPAVLTLGQDDIDGIQELYGAREAQEITLQGSASGRLSGTGEEARFQVTLPSMAAITLDGPADADFDLYVKRGAPPTTDDFDLRAWTFSAEETLLVDPPTPGVYHILVRSYQGQGNYQLTVKLV
jgi:peptidoglycan hydrolase-like protein with peptidoglycan-binding domain